MMDKEKWLVRKRIFDRIHRAPTTMVGLEAEITVMLAAGLIERKTIEWYEITEEGQAYDEAMEKNLPLKASHLARLAQLEHEGKVRVSRNKDARTADVMGELEIMGLVELSAEYDDGLYCPAYRLTYAGQLKVEFLRKQGEKKIAESNE
jgi:hypothetical protein